jgi:hypothetical protein
MIPVAPWRPEVLVAGGGPSGICAAIAAARNGARTLLIERYGFLGGTATSASVGPFAPFHHGDEQVIKGIPQEIIERLVALGGSTGHLKIACSFGSGTYMCWFDREVYKHAAFQLVQEAGAEILLHTWASEAVMKGDRIKGLIVQNKSGRQLILADLVIDTTGDGDVIAASGARYEFGREGDGRTQAMTMLFEMGGVDIPAVRHYIETHPADFEWWSPVIPVRPLPPEFQQEHFVAQGFLSLVKDAMGTGELHLGRNSVLLLTTLWPGMITFNSTRVIGKKGTDARELTEAEIDARRQVMSLAAFMKKHVPGFARAHIVTTGVQIGVRETRRLVGEYVLTSKDVVRGNKFPDGIARGYFPIDIHSPSGPEGYQPGGSTWTELDDSYDIPYRCCVPEKVEGLLVAGRCISVDHEAVGSTRSTGSCMALGQATGTAAALATRQGILPRHVNVQELRALLEGQGASIRRPEDQAPGKPAQAT